MNRNGSEQPTRKKHNRRIKQLAHLSLSERDRLDSITGIAVVFTKLHQRHHRIGAGRQNEDQRSAAIGVGERSRQVKGRRFDELLAEIRNDVILYRGNHLVRSQGSKNDEFWQADDCVEWGRILGLVGSQTVVDSLPFGVILFEILTRARTISADQKHV